MRPILFEVPFLDVAIYSYGTMLYLSFVVGWVLSLGLAERDGLPRDRVKACFLVTAGAALVGARLLYVVTNLGSFASAIDVIRVAEGGLVAYGGFLGGLVGSIVFCRAARLPILRWADCAVPALCTGLMITRVGCLLAGCDFGRPWDGPWAIQFPHGSSAFHQHVAEGRLPSTAARSLPIHPTQVYESLVGASLLGLVMFVRRHRRAAGEALAAFAMSYAVLRYFLETLRADSHRGAVGPLSTSQLIAILTFVAGLALLTSLRGRRAENLAKAA
jgi:phosphatidylglycerol---prolipoprotein diacylglyceryl transferase